MVVKRTSSILLAVWLLAGAAVAQGHPETTPQAVNRYVSVVVSGTRAEVILTLVYGDVPARIRRLQFDRNQDGQIDEAEQREGERTWAQEGAKMAAFRLNGRNVPWTGDVQVGLGAQRTVTAVPLVLEIATSVELDGQEHRIELAMVQDPPALGETEITIDLATTWRLTHSQKGEVPLEIPPQARHTWPDPLRGKPGDYQSRFTIRKDGSSAAGSVGGRPSFAIVLVGVGLLGTAGMAVWIVHRRRQRRPKANAKAARM